MDNLICHIPSSAIRPLLSNVTFDEDGTTVSGAAGVLNAWLLKFNDTSGIRFNRQIEKLHDLRNHEGYI